MLFDLRTLPQAAPVRSSDVCVVGSGPAGLAVASELAAKGISVTVLEAGGVEPDARSQALYGGESRGHPYYPLDVTRMRAFGGSSGHWWSGARLRPLDEADFEKRKYIPFSGWPFSKATLDPYYERAQAVFGLGPAGYDPDPWLTEAEANWPPRDGRMRTAIYQFADDSGFRRLRAALAADPEVHVYLNAAVTELICSDDGAVSAAQVISPDGRQRVIMAKSFVLATGCIENARLLLSSRRRMRQGLGNQHDLVGRFFMEHLNLHSGRIIPFAPEAGQNAGIFSVHERQRATIRAALTLAETARADAGIGGASVSLQAEPAERSSPGVMALRDVLATLRHYRKLPGGLRSEARNFFLDREHRASHFDLMRHVRRLPPELPGFVRAVGGRRLGAEMSFLMQLMVEQVPNPSSRVTLSEKKNRLRINLPRLDWRLSDQDVYTIVRTQEIMDTELRERGWGRVDCRLTDGAELPRISGSWHHMGTTRMHDDAAQGVVDGNGRVHGVPNLFVAGSSVFPTGGYANPTLTIVALALRLADYLHREARPLRVNGKLGRDIGRDAAVADSVNPSAGSSDVVP